MTKQTRHTALSIAGAIAVALAVAPGAQAAPQILSTQFPGPVAGKPQELRITARDSSAPVTGMVVGFGAGRNGFGLSSCAIDSAGRAVMPANTPATLTAPHTFFRAGAGTASARLSSAGCTGGMATTVQRLRYTVVEQGQKPKPVTILPPAMVPLGQASPVLPGLLPIPLSRVDMPVPALSLPTPAVPVPKLPVMVPGLKARRATATTSARPVCRGTNTRFRKTAAGQRQARASLLCLQNAERRKRGIRPVRMNARLIRAALSHSRAMVRRRFFAHVGPGSLSLPQRLRRSRYLGSGQWFVGENIAFGNGRAATPLAIHRAWMRSTPHRRDILERRYREVGFGIVKGAPFGGGVTYTADFGRRG